MVQRCGCLTGAFEVKTAEMIMFVCRNGCFPSVPGGYGWELSAFIIGVFLQLLGLPFVAVSQVSLFSKVTAEKTQGWLLRWRRSVYVMLKMLSVKQMIFKYFLMFHQKGSAKASDARSGAWPPSWGRCGQEA